MRRIEILGAKQVMYNKEQGGWMGKAQSPKSRCPVSFKPKDADILTYVRELTYVLNLHPVMQCMSNVCVYAVFFPRATTC